MNNVAGGKVGGQNTSDIRRQRALREVDIEYENWFKQNVQRPLEAVYQTYILELLLRQKPLPPSRDGRHIPLRVVHDTPPIDERRGHGYISNTIRSSRYTPWDFLPKQLFFQATRLNNFYFICIGIPQAIPGLSTTGSYTTILPVLFFILLTVFKEGYDDYRRHRLDEVENNSVTRVLRDRVHWNHGEAFTDLLKKCLSLPSVLRKGPRSRAEKKTEDKELDEDEDEHLHWARTKWRNIKVGDVVRLSRDEPVPADMVLLYAAGESKIAYIETMALDGETNLKSKQTPHALQSCSGIAGIRSCPADFVSEDPNRDLYDFNGRVTVNGSTTPLGLNEVIFRGSVLRNTSYAIGFVINTGEECKIRMNANHHPRAKKPRLEHFSNQVVLTLIGYVVLLSVGVSMGYVIWHRDYELHAWYLNNAYVGFNQIIIGFLIMFNNVIPLALYVSLEIVKVGQMIMVHGDIGMYDAETNTPMTCNTNTILENLGQVSYVLTDKTGTLTENIMKFRKMSIAGLAFIHHTAHSAADAKTNEGALRKASASNVAGIVEEQRQAVCGVEQSDEKKPDFTVQTREVAGEPSNNARSAPSRTSSARHSAQSMNVWETEITTKDLVNHMYSHPESALSQKACQFILCMALCHTALPEIGDEGEVEFQASSPDELALLQAAQDLGYLLVQRSSKSITLRISDAHGHQTREVYEVLDVIDFSSKRKRMSIIVRCPDGRVWLLCKGADSVILPRLKQAALANRKSHDVRRSAQIEREQLRRSEQRDSRASFGARPSLTGRNGSSMDIRADPKRTTLEVPKASHEVRIRARAVGAPSGRLNLANIDDASVTDKATVFTRCFQHLDQFATDGLRTLLFAQKTIPIEEYMSWKEDYHSATTSLTNRQERIEAAADLVEQGFELLGASAIEDKLQKDVPQTIEKLRRANIKIWMLTGDKRETAINIAHAASICKPESDVFILDASKRDLNEQLDDFIEELRQGCLHSVLVIDGQTLASVEGTSATLSLFYALIPLVDSVICCRASPAQKAGIVKAIRTRVPGALTLAIGDGANDIAMIQASHVGVGISGREGLQASRVADFSIAQFRFLQRLLLVHGRWLYVRTAKFILTTFYKEMYFYMMQALYQRYNGYTGSSLYENWSLTVLNTLFTSLCVILPGIFEQDLKAETLLSVPELFTYGQRNKGLNLPKYLIWVLLATLQGMIVWFISWAAVKFNVMGDNGAFALGDLCFSLGIVWTNYKLLVLETHYKTIVIAVGFSITVGGWWAWNGFMAGVYSDNLSPYDVRYGFTKTFGNDPNWWLTFVLILTLLILVDIAYKAGMRYLVDSGVWPLRTTWSGRSDRSDVEVDVKLWQQLEKDPAVQNRLAEGVDDTHDGYEMDDLRCADEYDKASASFS